MRLLIHALLLVMVLCIGAAVIYFYVEDRGRLARVDLARVEVGRFQQQIHLQAALRPNGGPEPTAPPSIDPSWFQSNLPRNPLLGREHPWLEVASPEQRNLDHPPDLAAADRALATFWYNPANGIVRARVPMGISDAQVLALYNDVNDCALSNRFTNR